MSEKDQPVREAVGAPPEASMEVLEGGQPQPRRGIVAFLRQSAK